MEVQRLDLTTEPLELGKVYLVPTVFGHYESVPKFHQWPVIGPAHRDRDFFMVDKEHFHVDGRFITPSLWQQLRRPVMWNDEIQYSSDKHVSNVILPLDQTSPRHDGRKGRALVTQFKGENTPLNVEVPIVEVPITEGRVQWRPMTYHRIVRNPMKGWGFHKCQKAYEGQQCKRSSKSGGWICPHRKANLTGVVPYNGVITCPLHALKICAETGVVLPADKEPPIEFGPTVEETIAILKKAKEQQQTRGAVQEDHG